MKNYAKALFAALAFLLPPLVTVPTVGQDREFEAMHEDVRCGDLEHRDAIGGWEKVYSKYEGKQMTASGKVINLSDGTIVLEHKNHALLDVDLTDPKSAEGLKEGQQITVRFTLGDLTGGCVMSTYAGEMGVIVKR